MNLSKIISFILGTLFPPACLACQYRLKTENEKKDLICESCRNQIKTLDGFYCPVCERRLPDMAKKCHSEAKFVLAAVASYEMKPVQNLIQALKYHELKSALWPWRSFIEEYLEKTIAFSIDWKKTVLIPTPLHKSRERKRGFNQAALAAGLLADCFRKKIILEEQIPIEVRALQRIKSTLSQTEMADYKERKKNVSGAFLVSEPEKVRGKDIILIDDVFTSGATMNEIATILKEAGAKKIIGFVLAKA